MMHLTGDTMAAGTHPPGLEYLRQELMPGPPPAARKEPPATLAKPRHHHPRAGDSAERARPATSYAAWAAQSSTAAGGARDLDTTTSDMDNIRYRHDGAVKVSVGGGANGLTQPVTLTNGHCGSTALSNGQDLRPENGLSSGGVSEGPEQSTNMAKDCRRSEHRLPVSQSNGTDHGSAADSRAPTPTSTERFYLSEHTRSLHGADDLTSEAHPFHKSARDVRDPESLRERPIVSRRGTVRGVKNRVRAGIACFIEQEDSSKGDDNSTGTISSTKKNFRAAETGRIIVYTTSMRIIRDTYERCVRVKTILQTHMVRCEERDVFMSRENQLELKERLKMEDVDVPQVFADGVHLGGAGELDEMNENGELRRIFNHFKKVSTGTLTSCELCGGYRYIPCTTCHGSKKSLHRNHFTEEFTCLRCITCDENGLIRCHKCHVTNEP